MAKSIVEVKQELRRSLKAKRAGFSTEYVEQKSAAICQRILESSAYQEAQCLMGYLAFDTEINIDRVLEQALVDGKIVLVPQIISRTEMVAVRFTGFAGLVLDRYGIRSVAEPAEVVGPEAINLVLVPGLSFGSDGSRMGMGAGYYDRYLTQAHEAWLLGVAYADLMQPSVPHDEYDFRMHALVNENGFLNFKK